MDDGPMTGEFHRHRAARVGRAAMGERLGGFIYGTIVALAVVVAGARAYPHGAGHIAVLVAATSVAFWLAHVYSNAVAHSVASPKRIVIAIMPLTPPAVTASASGHCSGNAKSSRSARFSARA